MTRTTTPNVIAGLAARLTDSQDRETYAALVSYVNELPPGDEFRQLTELLGLLSLVGQRVPDASADFLIEFRLQARGAAEYHSQLDARLASLPQEIAAGVDVAGVAQGMSEAFRQQLAATGLHDTAGLLKAATATIKQLSGELMAILKPAVGDYRGIASTLTADMAKLVTTARKVEEHNEWLMAREKSSRWRLTALAALVVFLVGGLAGILVEKRATTDLLTNIGSRVDRGGPSPSARVRY